MRAVSDSAWIELVDTAIVGGWVDTEGVREAWAAVTQKKIGRAETLFRREFSQARAVGLGGLAGRCLFELGKLAFEEENMEDVVSNLRGAVRLLRDAGNEKYLRDSLAMLAYVLREDEPKSALAVLTEAIQLYSTAVERGEDLQEALDVMVRLRIEVLMRTGDIVAGVLAIAQTAGGPQSLHNLSEHLHAENAATNRLPDHRSDVVWDEALIHGVRTGKDVWGCPAGCRNPGSNGFIAVRRGSKGNMPCPLCTRRFILLNRYYRFTAGAADRSFELSTPAQFTCVAADSVEILNVALVLRDGGLSALSGQLESHVFRCWEEDSSLCLSRLAANMFAYATILQDRDEHETALVILKRVVDLAEASIESRALLLAALNCTGSALGATGETRRAEATLLRAAQLDPRFPNPHYWLARLYRLRSARGDRKREEVEWNAYVDRKPASMRRHEEALSRLTDLAHDRQDDRMTRRLQRKLARLQAQWRESA